MELEFWIPIVTGIPDSKAQDSWFYEQKFPRFPSTGRYRSRSRPSDTGGMGGGGYPDPEIKRGAISKQFFSALRASVWPKDKGGGGGWATGPLPWIRHCDRFMSGDLHRFDYQPLFGKVACAPPPNRRLDACAFNYHQSDRCQLKSSIVYVSISCIIRLM